MVQINQGNVGSSIHVSIQNGILTMPDGSSIDLKEIQLALNDAFQETGEHDFNRIRESRQEIEVDRSSSEVVEARDVPNHNIWRTQKHQR